MRRTLPLALAALLGACLSPTERLDAVDGGRSETGPGLDSGAEAGPDASRDAQPDADCDTPTAWYRDQDGDGLGDPNTRVTACNPPDGYVDQPNDPQPLCQHGQGAGCEVDALQCIAKAGTHVRQRCALSNPDTRCTTWQDDPCPASDALCDLDTAECGSCEASADCAYAHGDTTPVCDPYEGECVQCLRDEKDACNAGGTQYVCNPQTHQCEMDRPVGSKTDCNRCLLGAEACRDLPNDCLSDDECQPDQACVDIAAGGGQRVCMPIDPDDAPCPRPYKQPNVMATSADGDDVLVCSFAVSTTCQAHADYRSKRCGTPNPVKPEEDQFAAGGNNDLCGEQGVDDGYCVWDDGFFQFLCLVPCFADGNPADCPADEDLGCALTTHAEGTRNLCVLD